MNLSISKIFERMRIWALHWAHTPHMAVGLFFLAFIESSIFPVPPDLLLVAILMVNSKRWWWYAGITTLGSVLGGLLGYAIGWGFYETVGVRVAELYGLTNAINALGVQFQDYAFLTVFTAAFTFIPFKVITISAGLFKISIWEMIFASLVGRGLRFFIVAYAIKFFGKSINRLIYKYFNILSIALVVLAVLGFLALGLVF